MVDETETTLNREINENSQEKTTKPIKNKTVKKLGRKKMSKKEREVKDEMLKNETKNQRFIRLINPRINKILKSIKGVEYLSGSQYECTDTQREQIFGIIENAVASLKNAYAEKSKERINVIIV